MNERPEDPEVMRQWEAEKLRSEPWVVPIIRPNWHEWANLIAQAVATRGDCTRSQVGAVLMDERTHEIVSVGYNGTDPGRAGCLDGNCPRGRQTYAQRPSTSDYSDCIGRHAEFNCLKWSRRWWRRRKWYSTKVMYVTRKPCLSCYHMILTAGIPEVCYPDKGKLLTERAMER